jgi:hypothetical protein
LIRVACVNLAAADTFTGALEWFNVPILDLSEWGAVVAERQKANKRKR